MTFFSAEEAETNNVSNVHVRFSERKSTYRRKTLKTSLDTSHQESHQFLWKSNAPSLTEISKMNSLNSSGESNKDQVNVLMLLLYIQQNILFCYFTVANPTAIADMRELRQMGISSYL